MNTINETTLFKILRELVEKCGPENGAARLNTFAVFSDYSDLLADNLKRNESDAQKNLFWARAWAGSGYDPAMLKIEYGALFLQRIGSRLDVQRRCELNNVFRRFRLIAAFLPKCEGCTNESPDEADQRAEMAVISAFDALLGYFTPDGGQTWLPREQYTSGLTCPKICDFVEIEKSQDVVFRGVTADGIRMAQIDFSIKICNIKKLSFSGEIGVFDGVATAKCETC